MSAAIPTFILTQRHRIWRVTLNGAFYGDYRSERQALAGIEEARRKLPGAARVLRAE